MAAADREPAGAIGIDASSLRMRAMLNLPATPLAPQEPDAWPALRAWVEATVDAGPCRSENSAA